LNVPHPRPVPFLSQYVVKKVAVHSGGKHAMALTLDGKVFSWGEGEDGKLGTYFWGKFSGANRDFFLIHRSWK